MKKSKKQKQRSRKDEEYKKRGVDRYPIVIHVHYLLLRMSVA